MARRRLLYGDQVDEGYYGMVNPHPPVTHDDPAEVRLQNLKEARYHAQNETDGRRKFNDKYYDGQHPGINEQIGLREEQVADYDVQIPRLQNHVDNPRTDLDEHSGDSDHNEAPHPGDEGHSSQPQPGWWDENADGHTGRQMAADGQHDQEHEDMVIGQDVLHPGHSNPVDEGDYDYEDEGDEFGPHEHDPHEHDHADAEDGENEGSYDDTYQGRSQPNPFSQAAYAQWHGQGIY